MNLYNNRVYNKLNTGKNMDQDKFVYECIHIL